MALFRQGVSALFCGVLPFLEGGRIGGEYCYFFILYVMVMVGEACSKVGFADHVFCVKLNMVLIIVEC